MTTANNKKDGGPDIVFGTGGSGLGGIFKGIENIMDLAADLKEAGGKIGKEGGPDFIHLNNRMKGVYGFSIKSAVGGQPVVETFGNIRKTSGGQVVKAEREPLTDVFDEKNEVLITVEIPGIADEGISLNLKEDILEISAAGRDRTYHKELILPAKGKPDSMTRSYNNGALEIRIKK